MGIPKAKNRKLSILGSHTDKGIASKDNEKASCKEANDSVNGYFPTWNGVSSNMLQKHGAYQTCYWIPSLNRYCWSNSWFYQNLDTGNLWIPCIPEGDHRESLGKISNCGSQCKHFTRK